MKINRKMDQIADDCYMGQTTEALTIVHNWKSGAIVPIMILIAFYGVGVYVSLSGNPRMFIESWIVYSSVTIFCSIWIAIRYFGRTTVILSNKGLWIKENIFLLPNFFCMLKNIRNFEVELKEYYNSRVSGETGVESIFSILGSNTKHIDAFVKVNLIGDENYKLFKLQNENDAQIISVKLNEEFHKFQN